MEGTEFGTVKFYRPQNGFGFIRQSNGGPDIFFHVSELPAEYQRRAIIQEGTQVQYDLGLHNGRTVARNVRVLEAAPPSANQSGDDAAAGGAK